MITITDKVKTFDDACKALGLKQFLLPNFSKFPTQHQKAMKAHAKLVIITEALNEGWKPDWTDSNEYKYYPWFQMGSSSGRGFSCVDFGVGYSFSFVGSRLCFKSRELAEYAGKQFEELYKESFVLE